MKKSCLLLLGVITLVIIGIATFFLVYKTNNPSESKILSEKFGISITNEMEVSCLENSTQSNSCLCVIKVKVSENEYSEFLLEIDKANYTENKYFNTGSASDYPIQVFLSNVKEWVDEDAIRMFQKHETKRSTNIPFIPAKVTQVTNYIFISNSLDGYRNIYLINMG